LELHLWPVVRLRAVGKSSPSAKVTDSRFPRHCLLLATAADRRIRRVYFPVLRSRYRERFTLRYFEGKPRKDSARNDVNSSNNMQKSRFLVARAVLVPSESAAVNFPWDLHRQYLVLARSFPQTSLVRYNPSPNSICFSLALPEARDATSRVLFSKVRWKYIEKIRREGQDPINGSSKASFEFSPEINDTFKIFSTRWSRVRHVIRKHAFPASSESRIPVLSSRSRYSIGPSYLTISNPSECSMVTTQTSLLRPSARNSLPCRSKRL